MYSSKLGLTLGFHGCDKLVCENLLNQKLGFKPSVNPYDWLGNGMYFWENDYERAMDFAIEKYSRGEIKEPAVIGAILDLGNCLNLLNNEHLSLLKNSYKILLENNITNSLPKNINIKENSDLLLRFLDCSVIMNLNSIFDNDFKKPFDSVRGLFIEGKPLYEGAGFREKDHIQICVRNASSILGYFLPMKQ